MLNRLFVFLKNKERINLFTNFISLVSVKGVDFLIPLFILPYLVRTLGISIFGLLSFSLAFCMYFGAVIHYGYSITAVRDISRVRNNLELLSKKYSAFLTVSALLLLGSLVTLIILLIFIPKLNEYWVLHILTFYFIAMQSLFPSWFFQGIEQMKYIAFINLTTKVLFLISLLLFVKTPKDYLLVPLLNAFAMTISTVISFWIIRKKFKMIYAMPNILELKSVIKEGRHSFIALFAPTLYNSTAMFILGYTTNNSVIGIYASATKLIDAFNSIGILLSTTFLPYLSRNIQKHLSFSKLMILVGLVLSSTAFIFSEELILILFSSENVIVSKYFKLLTPMILFIFIRFTYGPNYLMLIGKESIYKNIVFYSCFLFFIIAIIVIPILEIYGAIFILLVTTFVMAILTYFYANKYKLKD